MHKISLNGQWTGRCLNEKAFDGKDFSVNVPGSVLTGLLAEGLIEDPFYRTNEYATRELFRYDYEFYRTFAISSKDLKNKCIDLVCYGLDTICEVYINNNLIAYTDNMHRTWRFDVKEFLHKGFNEIRIIFRSPIEYMESHEPAENKEIHYIASGAMKGNQYIRKAHSMFGWDWGPQLVDAGIWRDIELEIYSEARLGETAFRQEHEKNRVTVHIDTSVSVFAPGTYSVKAYLYEPCVRSERCEATGLKSIDADEKEIAYCIENILVCISEKAHDVKFEFKIDNPKLWWPNNLGEQPLYPVKITLERLDGEDFLDAERILLEEKSWNIGLRTFTVSTEKDEWGHEFAFKVNGVKFFAMGADYIPEDAIYPRITRNKQEYLICSCVKSNFNTLRIWGGGYYPSDDFYDLCDAYGIIVWQDLMYACNVYELTDDFKETIAAETRDNVVRLRHHASLGLWCGNNEMESAWAHWYNFCDHSGALRADYLTMFEVLLHGIVKENDPDRLWWPSSPSSGGWIDAPDDSSRGDNHYWDVWHGQKPFTDYQKYYFRFCSEFGFQSFPSLKTIETFALPEDMNIFSEVMESHQKNDAANGKLLYYVSENFLYPKDFKSLIYVTQILQGLAVKFGVEHWRRNRGRCMGALFWQINDNWPVASWASVDYFGRWKALQYMSKNFFNPVALSIKEDNCTVEVWLENETGEAVDAAVSCKLKGMDFKCIDDEQVVGDCGAFCAGMVFKKDYSELINGESGRKQSVYLEVSVHLSDGREMKEVITFVPWKHVKLLSPHVTTTVTEESDAFVISLASDVFAPFVEIDFKAFDGVLEDNFFHITDEKPVDVRILKADISGVKGKISLDKLKKNLTVRSLRDSY